MATAWFNKLSDELEDVANKFEDGLSSLWNDQVKPTPATPEDGPAASSAGSFADGDFIMGEEEMMEDSPLSGIAEGVLKDIMSGQAAPQTPMEHIDAFRSAIQWSEPFILYLIGFQVVMLLSTVMVVRSDSLAARMVLMVLIVVLVKLSEWLNEYGAQHWESFSTQNYFDKKGIFMGILFCAPLLLDCFLMLLAFLREASQLLIDVKKMEVQKNRKKKTGTAASKTTAPVGRRKKKESKKED
uniref:Transmembrane protein 18 n=1 Tax=Attheya septentrionalis TaxID=420275 RepID=A0A7S2UMC0_9STRA|mmetsp:Transcript_29444/g.53932  ORF Transcript_29444/g.53932 Transcript_29444/m.53932 type:complete len:242 (+) Transcript_29444:237-962(+)|eukprot:CAMPEP_0198293042 /NCGR_PEP_ID=MMETSP1449-20131203/15112_1 /TAXON_ID=420275 /ORGANISM="Attheya septentrionalis, Strain CCMP2084" /LENGTH=241 /DNA_ID=CAMNT_0043992459 /DNA_START=189 /DNA_END=914 /DNA_ORIENTATION=-